MRDTMSAIKVYVDRDKDLTTHVVIGKSTPGQIASALEEFYKNSPTRYLLWDFSQVENFDIPNEELIKLLSIAKKYAHVRKKGKTAFINPGDFAFGMGRMYETFTEIYKHPIPTRTFRSHDEAMKWLFEEE